jgi:hypothetical protein
LINVACVDHLWRRCDRESVAPVRSHASCGRIDVGRPATGDGRAAGMRIYRKARGAVACWYGMVLDNVMDCRIVKEYPAKTGVKSSQSGNSSH